VISTARTESSKRYERKTQSFGFTSFDLHHNYKTIIWASLKSLKEIVLNNRGATRSAVWGGRQKVTDQNTFVEFVSINEEGLEKISLSK